MNFNLSPVTSEVLPDPAALSRRTTMKRNKIGHRRCSDLSMKWVQRDYPQLGAWGALAVDWLKGETVAMHVRLSALVVFIEKYLADQGLPSEPAIFLSRATLVPDFYQTACPDSGAGVAYNNLMHNFLNWVLLRDFSAQADDGRPLISPAYRNPIPRRTKSGPSLDETVHSPLPYGYVDELRQMLASGPNFCDWAWAQGVAGPKIGKGGIVAPDWFPVTEQDIDRGDIPFRFVCLD